LNTGLFSSVNGSSLPHEKNLGLEYFLLSLAAGFDNALLLPPSFYLKKTFFACPPCQFNPQWVNSLTPGSRTYPRFHPVGIAFLSNPVSTQLCARNFFPQEPPSHKNPVGPCGFGSHCPLPFLKVFAEGAPASPQVDRPFKCLLISGPLSIVFSTSVAKCPRTSSSFSGSKFPFQTGNLESFFPADFPRFEVLELSPTRCLDIGWFPPFHAGPIVCDPSTQIRFPFSESINRYCFK